MELLKQKVRELEILTNRQDIECKLKEIERIFLSTYFIKIKNLSVHPFEIEIYYFKDVDFEDVYTHRNELQKKFNTIYPHNHYGHDLFDYCIALEEKDEYYLSILFRSGYIDDKKNLYTKPSKLSEAITDRLGKDIFDKISESDVDLIRKDNAAEKNIKILYSSRVGLNKKKTYGEKFYGMQLRAVIQSDCYLPIKKLKCFPKKEELAKSYIVAENQRKKMSEKDLIDLSVDLLDYNMSSFIKNLKLRES